MLSPRPRARIPQKSLRDKSHIFIIFRLTVLKRAMGNAPPLLGVVLNRSQL